MRRAALIVALLATIACGSGSDESIPDFETVRAADLEPGDPLPTPSDSILAITDSQGGEIASLDIEAIEAIGMVRATIYEQWFERDVEFEGVWLEDLVAVTGLEADAIQIHALDDFLVDLDLDDVPDQDVIVATRADGERIPIEDGGPIRLVFLDPDGVGVDSQLWIWNIDGIAAL